MIDTELLHALADDELSADDRRKVEADLAEDPEAAKVLSSILAVKQAIASHVKPVECEDEWKRCRRRLDEMDKARRTEAFVGRYAWVMCTGLFAFIVGAGILQRSSGEPRLGAKDLAQMSASVSPVSLTGGIDRWLGRLFGKSPKIEQGSLQVVQRLQGMYNGRPVAQLNFTDSKGPLTLLVIGGNVALEGATLVDEQHVAGQFGQANYVAWRDSGLFLLLAADRSPAELLQIAEQLRVNRVVPR